MRRYKGGAAEKDDKVVLVRARMAYTKYSEDNGPRLVSRRVCTITSFQEVSGLIHKYVLGVGSEEAFAEQCMAY